MTYISYSAAPVPVRPDLPAAHERAWDRIARAGEWWTGAEHVAIAAEVRNASSCELCRARKAALSPFAVEGAHATVSDLPASAVDVVHRLVTDPGRLSRAWFDRVMAAGEITDGHYVELVDVLVAVVSIDAFCRGIGLRRHPLPAAVDGSPSQYRPAAARSDVGWVPMIPNGEATGREAGLYGPGGHTGNVIRALSLVPDAVRQLCDLSAAHYLSGAEMRDPAIRKGRLQRTQMELLAGRVSALRECFY